MVISTIGYGRFLSFGVFGFWDLQILLHKSGKVFSSFGFFVRRLSIMCQPPAFGQLHLGKYSAEGRILGAAGINAEADFLLRFVQMTDAHLLEHHAVR